MFQTELKYDKAFSVKFISGRRDENIAFQILERDLKLYSDDILSWGDLHSRHFVFRLRDPQLHDEIVNHHGGKEYSLKRYKVRIVDFSDTLTRIRVRNVPFELKNDYVYAALAKYGKVKRVNYVFRNDDVFSNVMTTERTAHMECIDINIPSTLFLSGLRLSLYISNYRQLRHVTLHLIRPLFFRHCIADDNFFPRK